MGHTVFRVYYQKKNKKKINVYLKRLNLLKIKEGVGYCLQKGFKKKIQKKIFGFYRELYICCFQLFDNFFVF